MLKIQSNFLPLDCVNLNETAGTVKNHV